MANFREMSIFLAKIGYLGLQLFLGKLFCFSSKVITFEYTSCTMYMIRYNNILRPVHDHTTLPLATPLRPLPTTLLPKIWGLATPQPPRIDAYDSQ